MSELSIMGAIYFAWDTPQSIWTAKLSDILFSNIDYHNKYTIIHCLSSIVFALMSRTL